MVEDTPPELKSISSVGVIAQPCCTVYSLSTVGIFNWLTDCTGLGMSWFYRYDHCDTVQYNLLLMLAELTSVNTVLLTRHINDISMIDYHTYYTASGYDTVSYMACLMHTNWTIVFIMLCTVLHSSKSWLGGIFTVAKAKLSKIRFSKPSHELGRVMIISNKLV